MNTEALIRRLALFPGVLRTAVSGLTGDEVRWSSSPQNWSVLEICCHLLDEEREDFRPRLESTLRDPSRPWPPLDLDDVSARRGYRTHDPAEVLTAFERERTASVAWLCDTLPSLLNASLAGSSTADPWQRSFAHPRLGPLSAGELLTAWCAHDALHLRQIAKRLYERAEHDGGFSARYAGAWGP